MSLEIIGNGSRTPRGQLNASGSLTKLTKKQKKQMGPPAAGAFKEKKRMGPTEFRRFYERGDLPVTLDNDAKGCKLRWRVEIEKLDFHHYLPLYFDGLRETKEPYASIASQGVHDLLDHGGNKILPTVPQLIIPLKLALDTNNVKVMCQTMNAVQHLVLAGDKVGEALVPYYRQLLPAMAKFRGFNSNTGDQIDYSQQKRENIGDLIDETLQLLEKQGGEDAYINIKYMVPTYESCMLN